MSWRRCSSYLCHGASSKAEGQRADAMEGEGRRWPTCRQQECAAGKEVDRCCIRFRRLSPSSDDCTRVNLVEQSTGDERGRATALGNLGRSKLVKAARRHS